MSFSQVSHIPSLKRKGLALEGTGEEEGVPRGVTISDQNSSNVGRASMIEKVAEPGEFLCRTDSGRCWSSPPLAAGDIAAWHRIANWKWVQHLRF